MMNNTTTTALNNINIVSTYNFMFFKYHHVLYELKLDYVLPTTRIFLI
jgi:hypothetical protein